MYDVETGPWVPVTISGTFRYTVFVQLELCFRKASLRMLAFDSFGLFSTIFGLLI